MLGCSGASLACSGLLVYSANPNSGLLPVDLLLLREEMVHSGLLWGYAVFLNSRGNEAGESQGKPRAAQTIDFPLILAGIPRGSEAGEAQGKPRAAQTIDFPLLLKRIPEEMKQERLRRSPGQPIPLIFH